MTQSKQDPPISLLLVEDEEATLHCLALILAKRYPHVAVTTADNGRAGLELFQARPVEIVVTDFNMPEMDGREMIGRIRAIRPQTRFVILTGDSGRLVVGNRADKGTSDHFIMKPVVFQNLFDAIEQCLEEIGQRGNNHEDL